jgi:hypothetical protein
MTPITLAAILFCTQEPAIESARTLTDGAARAGSWLPIEVVVSSPAAFDGDVAVEIDRITVSKAVRLAAGERQSVVVPALPWVRGLIDVLVRSGGKVLARRRVEENIRWLKDDEPLPKPPPGSRVDPSYFEEGAVFNVIEPRLDDLRPKEAWIRAKRDAAILFIIIFAFAGFVVLLAGLQIGRAHV